VHGWRKLTGHVPPAVSRPEFIPVAVAAMSEARVDDRIVELELHRGAVTVKVLWPLDATAELTACRRPAKAS
jgi:transposase